MVDHHIHILDEVISCRLQVSEFDLSRVTAENTNIRTSSQLSLS